MPISLPLTRPSPREAARLGLPAGAAYLAEMLIDLRLTRDRYDDLVLWGGLVARGPVRARALGLAGHAALSVALAAVFQAVEPLLPRWPGWARGLLFITVEHLLSFPTVALGDRIHPAVRDGRLSPLATRRYFALETARHLAYGLTLGALSGRKR